MSRETILEEVDSERIYQEQKWGGDNVDDRENGYMEWVAYITNYATMWFPGGFPPYSPLTHQAFRESMIKVAALAVAAVEQFDRKASKNG